MRFWDMAIAAMLLMIASAAQATAAPMVSVPDNGVTLALMGVAVLSLLAVGRVLTK